MCAKVNDSPEFSISKFILDLNQRVKLEKIRTVHALAWITLPQMCDKLGLNYFGHNRGPLNSAGLTRHYQNKHETRDADCSLGIQKLSGKCVSQ